MSDTKPGRLRPDDDEPHIDSRYSLSDIEEAMAAGFVTGCKRLAADKEFMTTYWRRGFEELAVHSGNGASMWFGKRFLTMVVLAMTGYGLVWLVKVGVIK